MGNYKWVFDNLDSSILENPSYTFPDTETYNIQLIADVNGICPDTLQKQLFIRTWHNGE